MPKRDKRKEMEERLGRIEDYLKRPKLNADILNGAIRQLGDGLNLDTFDPSRPVELLSLYKTAEIIDSQPHIPGTTQASELRDAYERRKAELGVTIASRLETAYKKITGAFNAYQKEKATIETIDALAQQAPVDPEIERVIFDSRGFLYVYRTPETRMLDGQFKEELAHRDVQLHTTELMQVFVDLANEAGYFAGVHANELLSDVDAPDLEKHVRNGFVALKKFQEHGKLVDIAVPVRFF